MFLGHMYNEGSGVPQDYVSAHMWFNLAAARGNEKARDDRNNLAKRMTPDQIAKAQRMAREFEYSVAVQNVAVWGREIDDTSQIRYCATLRISLKSLVK